MAVRIQFLANIFALALLTGTAMWHSAHAETKPYSEILEPGLGQSFVVGNKRAIAFYEKVDGSCKLTLLVGELNPHQSHGYSYASRVQVSVAPGKSTNIDSAAGQSINFTCNGDATSMDVQKRFLGFVRESSS